MLSITKNCRNDSAALLTLFHYHLLSSLPCISLFYILYFQVVWEVNKKSIFIHLELIARTTQ